MSTTFLIVSPSKEQQERQVREILKPLFVDPIDITRVSPAHSIGIALVRRVLRQASLKPFRGSHKAVVIEDAQALTVEAQNALLKTLEEPPEHTIIILLVSTNTEALLPTIISRCQVIEISTNNKQLAPSEFSVLISQFSVLMQSRAGERFKLAEDLAKAKEEALVWLEKMVLTGRQLLIEGISKNKHDLPVSQYLNIVKSLQRAHALLTTTNVNPRFALEILFLTLAQLPPTKEET